MSYFWPCGKGSSLTGWAWGHGFDSSRVGGPSPRCLVPPEFPDLSSGLRVPCPLQSNSAWTYLPAVFQDTFLLLMLHSGVVSQVASLGNLALQYVAFYSQTPSLTKNPVRSPLTPIPLKPDGSRIPHLHQSPGFGERGLPSLCSAHSVPPHFCGSVWIVLRNIPPPFWKCHHSPCKEEHRLISVESYPPW